MTDSTAQATPEASAKSEPKTVANDMVQRRVFTSTADAGAYLVSLSTQLTDFDKWPTVAHGVGVDDSGNPTFDPAIYPEGYNVAVFKLTGKEKTDIKAIVVTPFPSLELLLSSDAGKSFVSKIIDKELNLVAVRPLRDAEDVTTQADQMPRTVDAFLSGGRESAGIMGTFDDLQAGLNKKMADNSKVWAKARLTKPELKKALESAAYASEYYPTLENRGEGKDSLFVVLLGAGINVAKSKGLDPAIFQRWLDSRSAKKLTVEEDDDFDADSLAEAMLAPEPADDSAKTEADTATQ